MSIVYDRLWSAPKGLLLHQLMEKTGKHILILTPGGAEESDLFFDIAHFAKKEPIPFSAWEALPGEGIAPSPDVVGERYLTLKKIEESKEPLFVISSLQAALQHVLPQERFNELYMEVKRGDTLSFESLVEKLVNMGYVRRPICADKGEFAVRGGLIDLYPVSSPDPFRLEFFGDEVETIRLFDPVGQHSIRSVERIQITPGVEEALMEKVEKQNTLLDYLGKNTVIVLNDPVALEDRWVQLKSLLTRPTRHFSHIDQFMERIRPLQKAILFNQPLYEVTHYENGALELFGEKIQATHLVHSFEPINSFILEEDLLKGIPEEMDVTFITSTEKELDSLKKQLLDRALLRRAHFEMGYLSSGIVDTQNLTMLFPYTELTKRQKIRRQKQRSTYHFTPYTYEELSVGDTVVHLHNGIGRYLGMVRRPNHLGVDSEFFEIEYAEGGKLFVPLSQSYLITRYIGSSEAAPQLNTIGSPKWRRTKEKTEKQIMGYASELLEVYAKREFVGGTPVPEDSDEMRAFEEEFPYVETEDQLMAIEALKQDMQSKKAMDRLVCGDVGYGKTEVAMRAAFKAVVDGGKQVAMLVPTTILATQHYENFVERMAKFPVRVAHLSRFLKTHERKEVIEGIEKGTVDIVIGTHRLISSDIHFKNLGLVIIDEEQRFGVKAKEHLKAAKLGVDCLTLSATPIPRTLYMSMIGVRDVSTIYTPPQDRLPIKSVIIEPNEQILQTALLRELSRGGQSYVIHNRVETLFEMAAHIQKLVPNGRVIAAHGQMDGDEIDEKFHAFKQGRADILVATTIVESGIDIPNANTIIIDQADKFGIADLYQLRGRVGRWNRRAFCYFVVKNFHRLPELSRRRLEALAEASGYGGGMKVALRDLELRGAGDILGTEQSGHVSSIGFQLYCSLLQKTIKALKGDLPKNLTECRVELGVDARLPEDYVNDVALRMEFYRRFGEAMTLDELETIFSQLQDRFGSPPPQPAIWLYYVARLRVIGSQKKCTLIKMDRYTLLIERKHGEKKEQSKHLLGSFKDPESLEKAIRDVLRI